TQKQKTLVGGVSILGVAGIICKVVGVLYRIPLAHLIGPGGMGLYHKVYPAYNLLLTISSAGIPVAISRMVAHYVTREDPRNAKRIFKIAMRLLLALGVLTTALMLVFSGQLAAWQGTNDSSANTRAGYMAIAPSLFFVCVMSAYRGFLQGQRNMVPTAVSQLIEQIGRVFIALPLAALGMQKGGISWGAAGALLGSTTAEGAALLYMAFQHRRAARVMDRVAQRPDSEKLSDRFIANRLILVAIPITLGACIVPLAGFVDSIMLTKLMETAGMAADNALNLYGAYAGPVLTLINVPTAIAMAMSTNLVPDIASGLARGEKAYVAKEAGVGLRMASVVGFPCSVGMSLLAQPILYLCYRGSYTAAQLNVAADLLQISSLTIVLFTMVQTTSGILQGAGKQRIPMYTLFIGVLLKVALNYTLVRIPGVDIHGAPWASLLCYTASMIPNLYFVCKYTGYRFDWVHVVLKPLFCALLMGTVVWSIWRFGFGDAGYLNGFKLTFGILLCVVVGVVVYAFAALKCGAVSKEDLPGKIRRFIK
ncbi:MAG: polysaccharide biosynthesis protein, partial [Clostridia bacterium]|nr:polysaccharide biosynthesis protein [Clostridia bacterium]